MGDSTDVERPLQIDQKMQNKANLHRLKTADTRPKESKLKKQSQSGVAIGYAGQVLNWVIWRKLFEIRRL